MEQQYTRITTSLFEAIQKITSGSTVQEQEQELLSEGLAMPRGNDPHSVGVRVAMGSKEMHFYKPGSEEHKQFTAGHALGKSQVKKKMDSLEPKPKIKPNTNPPGTSLIRSPYASQMGEESQDVEEANIYVPPASHVSPSKPNSSKEDEKNRKASLLIDKIRSFRQLKQDYKEKGNLERHREFHNKLHDADKEYRKLGFQSLLRKDDHMVEEVELEEAMTPEFEKKFAETPKGVEVHMKHKETGKIIKNKFIGTHSAVAAAKKHIADMEKQGYEVHAKKLIEQEVEQTDEAVTDYSPKSQGGTRKELLAKFAETGDSKHAEAARKAGASHEELKNAQMTAMKRGVGKKGSNYLLSKNEEVEQTDEGAMSDLDADRKDRAYQTRQAKTTMKHIANPTPGERKAAKDIKPGIAGYRDRIAMLKSAEARGGLKKEEAEQFDETIIKEDLNIDAPEQFTFKDYLTAVTSLVGTELEEHEVVAVAYEAFRTQEEDIILEELTRDDLKQKMKAHMDAGHQISGEKFSMKDGKPYGEYVVTDKETGVRRKYIHHGSTRRVENMGSRTKKDAKAND